MNRMSFSETIFLFFLALIIFGPKKLPEIARQVGKALNEFRRASNEFKAQIEQEISNLEVENRKQTILAPSPTPDGATSRTQSLTASEAPATLAAPSEEPSITAATEQPPTVATEADAALAPSETASSPEVSKDVAPPASQESHV